MWYLSTIFSMTNRIMKIKCVNENEIPVPEVTRTINKMRDVEQRKAAKEFAAYWQNKGYEKGESQKF